MSINVVLNKESTKFSSLAIVGNCSNEESESIIKSIMECNPNLDLKVKEAFMIDEAKDMVSEMYTALKSRIDACVINSKTNIEGLEKAGINDIQRTVLVLHNTAAYYYAIKDNIFDLDKFKSLRNLGDTYGIYLVMYLPVYNESILGEHYKGLVYNC